jgi:hypothetical protein
MDIELIAYNINRMFDHRLNSQNILFDIQFKNYKQVTTTDKIKYEIKNKGNNEYTIIYTYNNELYKKVYINISINQVKMLLNESNVIIMFNKGNRNINQIIENQQYKCEFLMIELFLNDYRKNIYFTHCCKLDEKINDTKHIQYISSTDFNVLYNGLKENDLIFSVHMIDPSLLLPQIRIVKKI